LISVLLSIAVILASIPGCTQKDKEGSPREITVFLDWVPNTNHTGLYVAKDLGYYSEKGLDVEIIQPSEGGSADLVAAGKGLFGISYQEQVAYARTSKDPLPVIAIATIIQHNTSGFASPVDREIKSPADFEGKRYGGWGSPIEEAILEGLMDKYGVDFTSLEIVNIGAADFFISTERDVDFAWIYYGWTGIEAEIRGIDIDFMLLQDLDERLDFYTPVIITREDTAAGEPGLVRDFLAATKKGYEYSVEDPGSAASILIENVREIDSELATKSQEYLSKNYITDEEGWGFMKASIWETFGQWMYENDLIPQMLEAEKAFTNDFLMK